MRRATLKRERRVNRAHGAELHLVVARFEADGEIELVQIRVGVEDRAEAILFERAFLPLVEDQRQITRKRAEVETLDELDHDCEAGLHVGCACAVKPISFDAR